MSTEQSDKKSRPGELVVVGVDGSKHSHIALRWAVQDAARNGRVVHAVMVWNPDPLFATPPPAYTPFEEVQAEYLCNLTRYIAEAHQGYPDVTVTHALLEGDAAKQLVAQTPDAEMLILGSHGRGRLGQALLGSVSAACVRHATCPVLIIPPHMVAEDVETADTEQAAVAVPQQIAGPWL